MVQPEGNLFQYLSSVYFMSKILFINVLPSLLDLCTDILNGLSMIGLVFNWCDEEENVLDWFSDICKKGGDEERTFNAMPRKICGAISLSMIFWPGAVMALQTVALHIKTKEYNKIPHALVYLPFPAYIIYVEAKAFFHPNTRSYRQNLVRTLSMEAFYESFPQLVLQTITIIYGYPTNMIQILSISFSFLVLTKTMLMIDNQDEVTTEMQSTSVSETHEVLGSLKSTIKYNFWLFPLYISSVIYKVAVFSLTVAFFRLWSLLTMSLLVLQMIVLAKVVGFKDAHQWVYPVFNNLFLINIGGANIPNDTKEEDSAAEVRPFDEFEARKETERIIKKSYKFAKRSIVVSFFHHTLMLTTIVLLVLWYGNSDNLSMTNSKQQNSTYLENFFLNEVFRTKIYWQEMRSELYPYKRQESERCNSETKLDLKSSIPKVNLTSYSRILDACQGLEIQLHLYDFLLIIGGVTLVGLFNLVLSIYSARDVKIRKTLDNISLQSAKDDKETQTENYFISNKDEKEKAFELAFAVAKNRNGTAKRNSIAHFPVRAEVSSIIDDNSIV